jgi:hypothetical protein
MAKEIAYKVTVDTGSADENTEKLSKSIDELSKSMNGLADEMKSGFKSAEQSTKSAGKGVQGLAGSFGTLLKSLGLLAVAFAVFEYLKDLLMSNQRVANTFAKAFKTIDIVFGRVAKAVENLVDGLKELKKVDLKSISEQFKNFGKALGDSTDGALDLAEMMVNLENKVKKADATQRLYALTLQKEIEQQRQIRDNISLTIKERQDANDKIAILIDKQLQKEKEVANDKLKLALLEQEINNNNIESQIKVIEARAELADIEERLTGVLSEQKTNRESLRQEETQGLEELITGYESALQYLRDADSNSDFDDQLNSINQRRLDALAEYGEQLSNMRQYLKENNEGMTAEQIENHADMIAIESAYQKNVTKLTKEEADIRRQYVEASATQLAAALGSIAQSVESQGKAGLIASKVLAVAQIAIDTAVAVSGAIAQAQSVPFPGNIAAIATGVAAVIAGITSATMTLKGANVPGPEPTVPNAASVSAAAAPSVTPVTTNTTELGNTQAAELAPIQAFLVETQLTGMQNDVSQIEGQAEFGG